MHRRLALTCILSLGLVVPACGDGDGSGPARARPVTVQALVITRPSAHTTVTGVARPYQQADLSFKVSGTVIYTIDVGADVEGAALGDQGSPLRDEAGMVIQPGEVIARIGSDAHEREVKTQELKLTSARLGLRARVVELENISSAEVTSAEAKAAAAALDIDAATEAVASAESAYKLALSVVQRREPLVTSGAVSQADLDESRDRAEAARSSLEQAKTAVAKQQSAKKAADAAVARSRGQALLAEAQVAQAKAEIGELELSLENAKQDLADCTLRAPFAGRITQVHVNRGASVQAGAAIATLTLLNPMQVFVTVSARDERRLFVGDKVRLTPVAPSPFARGDGSIEGTVFEKNQVADPETGTFRLGLMAANSEFSTSAAGKDGSHPIVEDLFPIVSDDRGRLFVNVRCVRSKGDKVTVLHLPNGLHRGRTGESRGSVSTPGEVSVTLGAAYFEVANWRFRQLTDAGGLKDNDLLILDPKDEHLSGIVLGQRVRPLRPGDLVRVELSLDKRPEGFYVPVGAISERDGKASVFLVSEGRAQRSEVVVHEAHGDLRRIEGPDLRDGATLVVRGAHFLAHDEGVTIVDRGGR